MKPAGTTSGVTPSVRSPTQGMSSLKDLLIEQLNELYAAEVRSETVIPKLANAAASPRLSEALRSHLDETKTQIKRLDRVFTDIGVKPRKVDSQKLDSQGTKGLLEDCVSVAACTKTEPHVRDAALIAAMQRLEHDEMAGYGCARTWASLLGFQSASAELLRTLTEERNCDEHLSRIAETLNRNALEPAGAGR